MENNFLVFLYLVHVSDTFVHTLVPLKYESILRTTEPEAHNLLLAY